MDCADCYCRTFSLAGSAVCCRRDLFPEQSSGCAPELRTGIPDRAGDHVFCSHPSGSTALRGKITASSQKGYGRFRNSSFCQYSPVRLCSDRSIFRHDRIPDPVWDHSLCGRNAFVLCPAGCLCNRGSRRARRHNIEMHMAEENS